VTNPTIARAWFIQVFQDALSMPAILIGIATLADSGESQKSIRELAHRLLDNMLDLAFGAYGRKPGDPVPPSPPLANRAAEKIAARNEAARAKRKPKGPA
jgi:hypothetical protein